MITKVSGIWNGEGVCEADDAGAVWAASVGWFVEGGVVIDAPFYVKRKRPHYKLKRRKSVYKIFIHLHEYAKWSHLSQTSNLHKKAFAVKKQKNAQ